MCCPVSESFASVTGHGSSRRTLTQNMQLTPKNIQEQNIGLLGGSNPIEDLWNETLHPLAALRTFVHKNYEQNQRAALAEFNTH